MLHGYKIYILTLSFYLKSRYCVICLQKGKNNANSALTTCGVAVNAVTIRIVASVTITDASNGLAVLDHNERQKTRRWPPFANAIV